MTARQDLASRRRSCCSDMLERLLHVVGIHTTPRRLSAPCTPTDHPLRPILDARYLDMRGAMASGRGEAILKLLTSDFESISVGGKVTTASTMIESVLSLDIDRSKRTVQTLIVGIVERDGVATVDQVYSMTSHAGQKTSVPLYLRTFSIDRWRNVDGEWLLAMSETQEMEIVTGTGRSVMKRKRPS